jgi:hypothetical protein
MHTIKNVIPSASQKLSEESSCLVHWRTAFCVSSLQTKKIVLLLFQVNVWREGEKVLVSKSHLSDSSTAPSRSACSHSSRRLASSEYWNEKESKRNTTLKTLFKKLFEQIQKLAEVFFIKKKKKLSANRIEMI